MLTAIKPPAPHVVSLAFQGKVTKNDVAEAIRQTEAALETNPRVNLFFDLTELEGIEPTAIFKDLTFGLRNLGRLYRFQQMAVVTDNESLGKIVEWEDWIFRSVEIKRFPSQERDLALSWVERRVEIPEPGFAWEIEQDLLRFDFGETVTGYDVTRIFDLIRQRYEEHGPVRILAVTGKAPKYGPGVLYEKLRQFRIIGLIARCAVVGPESLGTQVRAFNTVLQTRLKHFTPDKMGMARAWVTDDSPTVEMMTTDSDHRFVLRITGKITSVEVESSYAVLLPHLRGDNSMDLLLEIPYEDGITLKALYQAVKLGIKHYSKVTQGIRRLALLTDSRFLSKATEVENLVISSIEERPFTFAQRDIAIAWLNEGRPKLPAATETIPL